MRTTRMDLEDALERYLTTQKNASIIRSTKNPVLAAWSGVKNDDDYVKGTTRRWMIEKAPFGWRVVYMGPGSTGQHSPSWWPSAGLGPGARTARETYDIIRAATCSLSFTGE